MPAAREVGSRGALFSVFSMIFGAAIWM